MTTRTARVLAWSLWAIAVVLAGASVVFLVLGRSTAPPSGTFGFRGFGAIFALVFGTVGALIASRQPANPVGWLLLSSGVLSGVQELAQQYAIYGALPPGPTLPMAEVAASIPSWIWYLGTATVVAATLLFPDGHLPNRRSRWALWALIAGAALGSVTAALLEGPIQNFRPVDNPLGIAGMHDVMFVLNGVGLLVYFAGVLGSVVAVIGRFRRSTGEERQQMKWVVAAMTTAGVILAVSMIAALIAFSTSSGEMPDLLESLVVLGFTSIPVAMGFAILKYHLYDIDLVISKTVVYGTLAVAITLIYLVIVAGVGAIAGSGGNVYLSAVAAAVVAVAFQPVRRWAQRLADRLVYGERASPYEVLSGFSERLGEAYSTEDVLPRMAQLLGQATGADRVVVWLAGPGSLRPAAGWPSADELTSIPEAKLLPDRAFEVRHQGEPLGAITVSMPPSEPLTPAHERLVEDVAGQAGLVMRNVALVSDLQESRRRIVATQDERAKKLERDIHDGAQQQLVALAIKQRLAAGLVGKDDEGVRRLLEELQAETNRALEDLRDLARGIYPPLLADRGLGPALDAQARKAPTDTTVEAEDVGRFPQEIESAVYFSVLEGLNNVVKYAEASHAEVRLSNGVGELRFEVSDDGVGFDPSATGYGTGLQGIADRLAALGGTLEVMSSAGTGTTVLGRIPVRGQR